MEHNDELVVNFKDLFFSTLYNWKKILAAMLVCSIALGGFQCLRKWQSNQTPSAPADLDIYQAESQLHENKINQKLNQIHSTQQKIEDIEAYLEQSVLMNADYHEVYKAKSAYYIDTDYQIQPGSTYQDADHTSTLITYYSYYLERYSLFEQVAQELDMEPRYLIELVSLTVDADKGLCITVTHSDALSAIQIQDALENEMYNVQKLLSETVCPHALTKIVDSCGSYVDNTLYTEQQNQQNSLVTLRNTLVTQKQDLKTLEGNAPKNPASKEGGVKAVLTAFIKWAVIGGVLGAGLVVVAIWVCVIFSDKITSPAKLTDKFPVRVLGSLPRSGKRYDAVTKAIRRMNGRPVEYSEDALRFMAANIINHAGNAKQILICGDADNEQMQELFQQLRAQTPALNLSLGSSMLADAQTLTQLRNADAVVPVVVINESRGNHIAASLKQIQELGKTVVGFVLVD